MARSINYKILLKNIDCIWHTLSCIIFSRIKRNITYNTARGFALCICFPHFIELIIKTSDVHIAHCKPISIYFKDFFLVFFIKEVDKVFNCNWLVHCRLNILYLIFTRRDKLHLIKCVAFVYILNCWYKYYDCASHHYHIQSNISLVVKTHLVIIYFL